MLCLEAPILPPKKFNFSIPIGYLVDCLEFSEAFGIEANECWKMTLALCLLLGEFAEVTEKVEAADFEKLAKGLQIPSPLEIMDKALEKFRDDNAIAFSAYLIDNMTALIVKGSKTERYRDKMMDLLKYMNRNRLGRDIRNQIKGHLLLQYESAYTDAVVLQDIPISIRAKISQNLYQSYIENVPLFKGCSSEFISQVCVVLILDAVKFLQVTRVPGEVIMEQGNVVDQLYFIRHGVLEEVGLAKDGSEETVSLLEPNSSFGDISIICNIPQPYTVRVCELCRLIHIDKQSFSNILEIYFHDGRRILSNLLQGKESNLRMKQLESDIALHIGKHEVELALKLNSAAYHGDLHQLRHLAASRGYEDITSFLIQEGVDINAPDKFGNTPVLEAIKSGHDRVASLLVKEGALLNIENAGSFLCMVIERGIQIYYEDYCQTVLIRTPKTMISECHFMLLLLKDNTQWQGCFWEPVLLFSQRTGHSNLYLSQGKSTKEKSLMSVDVQFSWQFRRKIQLIFLQISQNLYQSYIENVPLFKGCSSKFISQVEEVSIAKDGSEETMTLLEPNSSFREISIACNIPQPYIVRVCELCRLIRIDKQSFSNILEIYFHDGRRILSNLLQHLAASRGYEDITSFLIQEGVDINALDKFGNTPLLEAIKSRHDRVASLLVKEEALLSIENTGSFLCMAIAKGDSDLLQRLLSNGVDPNTKDYDQRTPLYVAATQGQYSMAKLFLGTGASVFSKDRWRNTPVDEARVSGNKQMISLLEKAKSAQLSEFPDVPHEISDKLWPRKYTVFPFHPWESKDLSKHGVFLWIPQTIEELVGIRLSQTLLCETLLGVMVLYLIRLYVRMELYLIDSTLASDILFRRPER
ncbi:Potassium channel SKOR [Capsicum annuum]|uniref:Potassium channel n=1 Tax=Capsicum annuum TaxID=4072 RepID=A0A2G2ZA01_CAPAN|nr:Potassium channel SKOR [Capsicum annuum]PHT78799.1 Potassium channel SKOR [Capsicum annuum]